MSMRISIIPSLQTLLLVFLDITPQVFANPTSSLTLIPHPHALHSVASLSTDASLQKPQIQARANTHAVYGLPNGWMGRIDSYLSLLPVQIASHHLQEFYNGVTNSVMEKWISQPPVNHFSIGWKNIQLEFFSPTRTVPWNFILGFLQRMARETLQGFTGRYDVSQRLILNEGLLKQPQIFYIHLPTGEQISVTLSIPLVAAAA